MSNSHMLTSNSHKSTLRARIIRGARNYKKFLIKKYFGIIDEDGAIYEVCFYEKDFKHLTGLYSHFSDKKFFEECVRGHIANTDIDTNQHYNWATLKDKSKRIESIHELMYKDCDKSILINPLPTNTTIFPLALKNTKSDICVAFAGRQYKARSLRTAKRSSNSIPGAEKKVIAIFSRPISSSLYNELVYITDLKNVCTKCPIILSKIDCNMQDRFSYII